MIDWEKPLEIRTWKNGIMARFVTGWTPIISIEPSHKTGFTKRVWFHIRGERRCADINMKGFATSASGKCAKVRNGRQNESK